MENIRYLEQLLTIDLWEDKRLGQTYLTSL